MPAWHQLLARLARMEREQWLPTETIRQRQWRRLERLLRHAYECSPFHRARFAAAGLTPRDIRRPEDLALLPVTTREDLADDRMLATGYPRRRLRSSLTSGSTGRVTTTYFDETGWITAKILLKARARLACGVRPWHRIALFQEEAGGRSPLKERLGRRRSFSILDPLPRLAAAVESYRASVFYGFPSFFMRFGEAAGGRLAPQRIFTSGEMLDARTRRAIESDFKAPVLDIYGCTEVKEIAWECTERDGYHINSDWIVVEQGADERLLVTPLYNYGMPLLRYEVGDTGSLLPTACRCGRGLPLMTPNLGRVVDYPLLPDGTSVSPYALTVAVEALRGIRQYQITQETRERVVIRVVPLRETEPPDAAQLREVLAGILPGLQVLVRFVERIEAEPSGKYRIVASRVADEGLRGPSRTVR